MTQVTYPGVYIDEPESGVRTITGVATSITAFVGRALRGLVDEPVMITSFADFQRQFGGLWHESNLGYAVLDFFQQGGSIALIVRVFQETAPAAATGTTTLTFGAAPDELVLSALSPGEWGSHLTAGIDTAVAPGLGAHYFNLTVTDASTTPPTVEVFRNVTELAGDSNRVDKVLAHQSNLVKVTTMPTTTPAAGAATVANGDNGAVITQANISAAALQATKQGIYALDKADLVNLIVIPPYSGSDATPLGEWEIENAIVNDVVAYAAVRRAMYILDAPYNATFNSMLTTVQGGLSTADKNAAMYFPRIIEPDQLHKAAPDVFPCAGAVAGAISRTDATRGVWKAPAGLDAILNGVMGLSVPMNDTEIGQLNQLGLNCLRTAPQIGSMIWGARTRQGSDIFASAWKYLPVRRTALFLEESLFRGLQWVVFEPNDEPLWAQIRLNVGSFMHTLFQRGAFEGTSPAQAYFVKCDGTTTTQNDINLGIVNIQVGFAPLKPAEFVILHLQQIAGQLAT